MRIRLKLEEDVLLHALQPLNVLRPAVGSACAGDANYTDGTGTDDAATLQALINQSIASSGVPVIEVPSNRTYRLSTTITIPYGIVIRGLGGRGSTGTGQPATFVWSGSSGGTMFDVAVASQNIPMVRFEDILLTGRTDGTTPPKRHIRFRGTGGVNTGIIDTGTILKNVWCQRCSSNSVMVENGATNFFIENGRIDTWGGYALSVAGASASITISGNMTMASSQANNGMIFLNGEVSGRTDLKILGLHIEAGPINETYSGGANPYDRAGVIRLGVNSTCDSVQHYVHCIGLEIDAPFSIPSRSIFQITASTTTDNDLDNSRMVSITCDGGKGLNRGTTSTAASDEFRILGGRVHSNERPPLVNSGNVGYFQHALGKNTTSEQITSWINTRDFRVRGLVKHVTTAAALPTDFPKQGMEFYVSDASTNLSAGHGTIVAGGSTCFVPVFYDGTDWRIG